jgi:hypothetical protein
MAGCMRRLKMPPTSADIPRRTMSETGMTVSTSPAHVDALRAQLMAPDPMQRFMALHALEVHAEQGCGAKLAVQVEAFAARGVPYYAPNDPHYQAWVDRALGYWERLHAVAAE